MRILFIHEVNYLTKPIYEMHEFPEHLAARGHELAFWHFPEGYSKKQIAELGWKRTIPGRVVRDSELTLFTPQNMSGSLFGRLLTAFRAGQLAKDVINDFRPDLVVSLSVPTSGWQALQVTRKMGIPYIFRALDVSHKIRKGLFGSLIRICERFIYRNSDFVSANNQAMLEYCSHLASSRIRGAVHFPPLDLSAFRSGSRVKGRKRIGIDAKKKVILYLGSFFYFSGLPEVLKEFKTRSGSEYLVLVGGGEQDSELRQLAKSLGIEDRVIFTGFIPFSELPDLIAAAEVCINPMEKTLVSDAALPNKVLQYLAAGIPTVSTALRGLVATFPGNSVIYWASSPNEVLSIALNVARNPGSHDFGQIDLLLRSIESTAVGKFEEALFTLASEK